MVEYGPVLSVPVGNRRNFNPNAMNVQTERTENFAIFALEGWVFHNVHAMANVLMELKATVHANVTWISNTTVLVGGEEGHAPGAIRTISIQRNVRSARRLSSFNVTGF